MHYYKMPYKIIKNRNSNSYKVINKDTGKIHSFHSSKLNAEKQIRLLEYIDHRKK